MVINTNISAATGSRLLADSSERLSKSLARLSSGSKITSPEDDAGGMAVSMRFDAQINRINAANTNVGNSISFAQTQDSFLQKVSKAFDRMSELSILAQDVTKSNEDRSLYDKEFQTLDDYVVDLAKKDFNGVSLFNGDTLGVTIDSDGGTFDMTGIDLAAGASYTAVNSLDVTSTANAATALTSVKDAIKKLADDRSQIGANIVRLHSTSAQLVVLKDNLASANSRIKDLDVADESTQFARYNILVQAGTAMLAQANATPQSALRLLG